MRLGDKGIRVGWGRRVVLALAFIVVALRLERMDGDITEQRRWMAEHAKVHDELNVVLEGLRRQDGEAVKWLEDHERWIVQFSEGCIEVEWCEEWVDG